MELQGGEMRLHLLASCRMGTTIGSLDTFQHSCVSYVQRPATKKRGRTFNKLIKCKTLYQDFPMWKWYIAASCGVAGVL